MMMAFIDAHREDLGIEPICRELAIAPSSYHEHAVRLADPARRPARARRDDELKDEIKRVYDASSKLYGRAKSGIRCAVKALRWPNAPWNA
ncbi:putative transposase [Gluconacetobacter diazotrophicus PA1 5]|uniref:Putative transposase n=1 Tax=Gluconacetobacter diazotrophicus (strain ATCC 49037 / DSM 5601 / CCUG 37298 / CIP 103539 / LMG 7603 / PAl5) TaxID=272568 RepID=A9HCX0_GLUDA|nr:putative transposase [Gluconacetobacter diazotrophicus PA1 5]